MNHQAENILVKAKDDFNKNVEYGFTSLSGLFDKNLLLDISSEIDKSLNCIKAEKNIYGSYKKYKNSNINEMPENTRNFIKYLNSQSFINILERISGIAELLPDNELQGGGIHAIEKGGYLKLHTDFNWNENLNAHRRLNLIIYLNEKWNNEWGGCIELWDSKAENKIFDMSPEIGNILLFATNDYSYHGHPDPLNTPCGIWRKSIALYYYTKERPANETILGNSVMTNYVERPGEIFKKDKIRRIFHKIKINIKKLRFRNTNNF